MNYSNDTIQNTSFNRKLNHYQSVIGLANWNFASPTYEQIKSFESRGRSLQAAAIRKSSRSFAKWLWIKSKDVTGRLLTAAAKNRQHRKEINQLLGIEDFILKDIGLSRADVYAVAHNKITTAELNARRGRPTTRKTGPDNITAEIVLPKCTTIKLDTASKPACSNDQSEVLKIA